jgi:hypothetical protein
MKTLKLLTPKEVKIRLALLNKQTRDEYARHKKAMRIICEKVNKLKKCCKHDDTRFEIDYVRCLICGKTWNAE